jgi:carbonic anhydrase/acetyltransferase-like protein (isoleucine patch superfamily)
MLYSFEGKTPKAAKNTFICETAMVIGNVLIGEHCYIGHGAVIRGDSGCIRIGSGSAVEEGVIIHAPPEETCDIGEKTTLGHGAIIHGQKIGDYAVVGMGAIMGINSRIGKWTIIGEGGIVRMRQIVPDSLVVGGNPARTIRETSEADMEFWTAVKFHYSELAGRYLNNGLKIVS